MRFALHSVFVLLALAATLFSAPAIARQAQDATATHLDSLAAEADITGYALAAISAGELSWTHEYGVRSAVTNPPVTANTVFEAAALGKPVLAYVTLRLADAGRLELDRPLSEYATLPDDTPDDPRFDQLTARMVLMHGTGLPNWRPVGGELAFEFDPGMGFSYSGEATLLLQYVIERLALKTLDALAQEHVFGPFGMDNSSFVWQDSFAEQVAVGHTELGDAQDKFVPETANAAYSLHTTPTDYALFLAAVARGEGLSPELAEEMRMAQVGAGDGIYWGLGWGLQPTPGGMALWHWGDTSGYKSFAFIQPASGDGFVYLSNSNNGMLILHAVYDRLIGGEQTAVDWLQYETVEEGSFLLARQLIEAYGEGDIKAMLDRYESAKDELPDEAYAEISLNTLGYKFLRLGLNEEAVALFELNTQAYPDAYNTFDSLAEGYLAQGRPEEALAAYRRAVQLNPEHTRGRRMIQVLEQRIANQ